MKLFSRWIWKIHFTPRCSQILPDTPGRSGFVRIDLELPGVIGGDEKELSGAVGSPGEKNHGIDKVAD